MVEKAAEEMVAAAKGEPAEQGGRVEGPPGAARNAAPDAVRRFSRGPITSLPRQGSGGGHIR